MNRPRFEVVQTDAEQPWHARFVGGNGETVWTTENYADQRDAVNAITMLGPELGFGNPEARSGR